MQKQKLFQMFSCVDHYAPELLGMNRVVNHDVLTGSPEEVVAAGEVAPKKSDVVAGGAEDAGKGIVSLKKGKMDTMEAMGKVTRSVSYLQRQDKSITQERLTDALKDQGYLKSEENPPSPVDMVEAIKAMQRDLGFTDKSVDGEIGKNTYGKMAKGKPDMYATLTGTAKREKSGIDVQKKPELPAGRKAEVEAQLSQISYTIQMNYKTVARLQDELFKTDGTLKQSPNTDDLTGYKVALDNISGQLKTVDGIEGALKEYKVPANFMLTITDQSGDTKSSRVVQCTFHNNLSIPKSTLFSANETDGRVFAHHYEYMQNNFEKRLAEFKRDYDNIVKDWAQRVAGKEGRTGNDVEWQNLHKIFENEPVPAVLALLDIKTEKFNVDVKAAVDIILAERNAKEDKEMADAKAKAEEGVANAETKMASVAGTVQRVNAEIMAAERANASAKSQVAEHKTALQSAQAYDPNSKTSEFRQALVGNAEQAASETAANLAKARAAGENAQREYAKAEKELGQKQQELAALTTPNPDGGAAAATDGKDSM